MSKSYLFDNESFDELFEVAVKILDSDLINRDHITVDVNTIDGINIYLDETYEITKNDIQIIIKRGVDSAVCLADILYYAKRDIDRACQAWTKLFSFYETREPAANALLQSINVAQLHRYTEQVSNDTVYHICGILKERYQREEEHKKDGITA